MATPWSHALRVPARASSRCALCLNAPLRGSRMRCVTSCVQIIMLDSLRLIRSLLC
jgi:hypothetical protein